MTDLCAGPIGPGAVRERILAWLAEGAREVSWALCTVPRDRWAAPPPERLDPWPALRHVRHLVLHERHITLPAVQAILDTGAPGTSASTSTVELDQADAAWDADAAIESADTLLMDLTGLRFDLGQRLEAAPDDAWHSPSMTPQLAEPVLHMRQHELEHLATIWRIALYWDRVSPSTTERHAPAGAVGLPFHPADRLEESH